MEMFFSFKFSSIWIFCPYSHKNFPEPNHTNIDSEYENDLESYLSVKQKIVYGNPIRTY